MGQYTVAATATTLGVSRASIYRHLTAPAAESGVAAPADRHVLGPPVEASVHRGD